MCSKIYVSNGPVCTLPGALFSAEGNTCDEHEGVPAIYRIQGETDSFGAEYFYVCQDCYDKYKKGIEAHKETETYCDWCKSSVLVEDTRQMRDFEEGSFGPVYTVCKSCQTRQLEYIKGELDRNYFEDPDEEFDEELYDSEDESGQYAHNDDNV